MKKFKNIKLTTLIIHIIVTLAYPVAKVYISTANRLLIFTDTLTIVSLIMIAIGLMYSFVLHGDFDIMNYHAGKLLTKEGKPFDAYEDDRKAKREESFNYTLFLGLFYLAVSIILANTYF